MSVYYDQLSELIKVFADSFEDRKVTLSEAWSLLYATGHAAGKIIEESVPFSDSDASQLIDAAQKLFDEHIKPLDLPGPDRVIDPVLRNWIIPSLVEGVREYIQRMSSMGLTENASIQIGMTEDGDS